MPQTPGRLAFWLGFLALLVACAQRRAVDDRGAEVRALEAEIRALEQAPFPDRPGQRVVLRGTLDSTRRVLSPGGRDCALWAEGYFRRPPSCTGDSSASGGDLGQLEYYSTSPGDVVLETAGRRIRIVGAPRFSEGPRARPPVLTRGGWDDNLAWENRVIVSNTEWVDTSFVACLPRGRVVRVLACWSGTELRACPGRYNLVIDGDLSFWSTGTRPRPRDGGAAGPLALALGLMLLPGRRQRLEVTGRVRRRSCA